MHHRLAPLLRPILLALLAVGALAAPLAAAPDPLQPAGSGGLAAVERALDRLPQHRRLLLLGAHPDDEDDTLLSVASLGDGTEVAYVSLTRGEGGQNVIGPELGESLGVLRSEELLGGRRIDLARQLFTRAYDFGYTESMSEAFARWPREQLLVDVVRAIRRFRPQVIVAIFPADERAGHGQHQVSGAVADDAVRLAADTAAFPQLDGEGLRPWQPEAFFRESWWDPQAATLELSSQGLDPLTGHTLFQLAMAVRSLHRSQSEGQLQALEGRAVRLHRETPAPPVPEGGGETASRDLFAGIDTSLAGLAGLVVEGPGRQQLRDLLLDVERQVATARQGLTPAHLAAAAPPLAAVLGDLRAAQSLALAEPAGADATSLLALLAEKEEQASEALAAAAGVVVDATSDQAEVVPGASLAVTVRILDDGSLPLQVGELLLTSDEVAGWSAPVTVPLPAPALPASVEAPASAAAPATNSGGGAGTAAAAPASPPADTATAPAVEAPAAPATPPPPPQAVELAPGGLLALKAQVTVDAGAAPTVPYFLRRPRQGDLYDWDEVPAAVRGEPFEPPPLRLQAELTLPLGAAGTASAEVADGGATGESTESVRLRLVREVVAVGKSLARGEVRRPLRAVPAVEVAVAQGLLPWPLADTAPRHLLVTLTGHAARQGQVSVLAPVGWPAVPLVPFQLAAGESRTFDVPVAPPAPLAAGRGAFVVGAVTDDGVRYAAAYPLVDYEHVRPRPVPVPSLVEISAFPLELPKLARVGYVRGAADQVPEALQAVGVPLEVLSPADLPSRDLGGYDALVIGPRAYDAAPELAAANGRLLDFVRAGGLLIVQSQRADYFTRNLAPVPLTMARGNATRTTDETAAVRLLAPDHPVLTTPNAIDAADWEGWVQERGLYYPQQWDPAYVPLLAMADPGKPELSGALLVAPYGQGTFVYTGLAFFRQLPAGVPGAYRLFANLLALAHPRVQSEDLPTEGR